MRYGTFWDQTTFIISGLHYISSKIGRDVCTGLYEKMAKGNIFIIMIYGVFVCGINTFKCIIKSFKIWR